MRKAAGQYIGVYYAIEVNNLQKIHTKTISRNGVETTPTPRMTTKDSFYGQSSTFKNTMF